MRISKNGILAATLIPLLLLLLGCSDHLRTGVDAYKVGKFDIALKELIPIAEAGSAEAQLFVGFMYDNGEGVTKNYTQAAAWYGKAADQGESVAQYNLGMLYWNGLGVKHNTVEAFKLFTVAAISANQKAIDTRKEAMSSLSAEQIKQGELLAEQWFKQHDH